MNNKLEKILKEEFSVMPVPAKLEALTRDRINSTKESKKLAVWALILSALLFACEILLLYLFAGRLLIWALLINFALMIFVIILAFIIIKKQENSRADLKFKDNI